MKTASITLSLASLLLVGTAYAGPGSNYYKTLGNPAATTARRTVAPCPGTKLVPNMVMRPAQANQRGPMIEVQEGTRSVCTMCPVTKLEKRYAFSNKRGPWTFVATIVPGAEHDCVNCAAAPKG